MARQNIISTVSSSPHKASMLWVREFLDSLLSAETLWDLHSAALRAGKNETTRKALAIGASRCEVDARECALTACEVGLLLACFADTKAVEA